MTIRRSGVLLRSTAMIPIAATTITATPVTTGDCVNSTTRPAPTSEPIATPRRTDRVRYSTANVTIAISATSPIALREPMRPWIGPPTARLPWMPSPGIAVSMMSPANTSMRRATPRARCGGSRRTPDDLDGVAREGDRHADERERELVRHRTDARPGVLAPHDRERGSTPRKASSEIGSSPCHSMNSRLADEHPGRQQRETDDDRDESGPADDPRDRVW